MSRVTHTLLIAAVSATLLGAAPAMAHRMHDGGDASQRQQRMEQRMAEHQQQLKLALQITPQQESAWTRYTDTFKRPAQAGQRPDHEAMARLSTPERLDRMLAHKAERDAHLARRVEATRALYAALTPEQQKVFDQHHAKQRGSGHHGHHGHKG